MFSVNFFFLFRTPMHKAAEYGHVEILKLLVEYGANHGKYDYMGRTPLLLALAVEEHEAAEYLSSL